MHRARTRRRRTVPRLLGRLAAEHGSGLVEVMVSATLVLIGGVAMLAMIDRTTELGGEQRAQAVAGNLAQAEIDTVKAFPLADLSNMRRSPPPVNVAGVDYSITTRADWVNDTSMTPNCTTPGATADYLKVQTTVTYPGIGSRRPAVLDTIVAPPVRAFDADHGALAVFVKDRSGAGVAGATVSLTGPATLSDTTNANGCVLWGQLPSGSGYTVAVSKAGYVTPAGAATAGGTAGVTGEATSNVNYEYDSGGSIRTNFKVKAPGGGGALIPTKPMFARVDNGTGAGFSSTYDIGATATSLDTSSQGLLFPFANAYSVRADTCLLPTPTSATVAPGGTVQTADIVLPAQHITVRNNSAAVNNATVRVKTACTTVYQRQTNSQGRLDDPGFPNGTGFTLCATNGVRKRVLTGRSNNTSVPTGNGTNVTMDIGTSGSVTTSPNACP